MDVSDYAACDATALAELIASRQVSAAEVRRAALQAIEQVEPELNAVVSGPFEDAAAGEGPFAGVPFGVKDTLWEQGRPYDFGSRLLEGQVAPLDSTIAERFRAAGLLSLVRTATPEFGGNFDTAPVLRGADPEPVGPDPQPRRLERRLGRSGCSPRAPDRPRQRRRRLDSRAGRVVRAGRAQALARANAGRAAGR